MASMSSDVKKVELGKIMVDDTVTSIIVVDTLSMAVMTMVVEASPGP